MMGGMMIPGGAREGGGAMACGTGAAAAAVCVPKRLPRHLWERAALDAMAHNPANAPNLKGLGLADPPLVLRPQHIAVLTGKYWLAGTVLTVGFLDSPPAELRARILAHCNAWSARCNIAFVESRAEPLIRIARAPGDGHWSYLGTDNRHIPAGEPTMNLDSFTMATDDREFFRVVRHEAGHALGAAHEHMRRELVARIDPARAIRYFGETQGWPPEEVRAQVLTPLEEASLWGTPRANPDSIMCYQVPGTLTVDGEPIPGGADITEDDYQFMARVYPGKIQPATAAP
jgi:hypothetical protein